MSNTFGSKGFCAHHASCLVIEEAEVPVHDADEPDLVGDLFDADVLTGKDLAEIDLAATDADPSGARDGDRERDSRAESDRDKDAAKLRRALRDSACRAADVGARGCNTARTDRALPVVAGSS